MSPYTAERTVYTEMSEKDKLLLKAQFEEAGVLTDPRYDDELKLNWETMQEDLQDLTLLFFCIACCFASNDSTFTGNAVNRYEQLKADGENGQGLVFSRLTDTSRLHSGNKESAWLHKTKQITEMRNILLGRLRLDPRADAIIKKALTFTDLDLLVHFSFVHDMGKIIGASEKNHTLASGVFAYPYFEQLNKLNIPHIPARIADMFWGTSVTSDEQQLAKCIKPVERKKFNREDVDYVSFLCARHHIFADLLAFFNQDLLTSLKAIKPVEDTDEGWAAVEQQKLQLLEKHVSSGHQILNLEAAVAQYPFLLDERTVNLLYIFTVADIQPKASYSCNYGPQNLYMYLELMKYQTQVNQRELHNQLA